MTLKELSKQYYKDAENLTEEIKEFRERAKSCSGAKLHIVNRQLICLYEMRRDALMTAEHLDNYYEKSGGRLYHRRPTEY